MSFINYRNPFRSPLWRRRMRDWKTGAAKWRSKRIQDELRDWRINRQIKRGNSLGGDRTKEKRQGGCRWEDCRRKGGELDGERVESSTCGPRGNIFTLPSSFSSFFLPSLFLPRSLPVPFHPLPPHAATHSRSSSFQSELTARQMKIYRSPCPVGGFNLICHSVVAETTKGERQSVDAVAR